jgi:hypothetical protein
MMKRVALAMALALVPATAAAWEPQTTHAGLAEQAALASRLHKRLVTLGWSSGLFEPLTIPPADAPALATALKLLSPPHGSVPDGRGRQAALSWLTAGAALADVPVSQAANHFFDPTTGAGWIAPSRGLPDKIVDAIARSSVPSRGVPAPDWLVAKDNPFSHDQFLNQYAKAVSAKTPGERSRYMAAALIAAGAMLHTLGDLGAPARVRGDSAAQLDPLGSGTDDLGSRFEQIASLVYGRLGVPPPSRVITRGHLRDFVTSKDGGGLADLIARSYFSPNTLPEPTRISGDAKPVLVRPRPALPPRLNLVAASRDDLTLRSPSGVCLARYRAEHDLLRFTLDDDCQIEQLAQILPEVAAYEAGMLDFLLRGELTITVDNQVTVSSSGGAGLAAGRLEILVEDNRGVRTQLTAVDTAGGAGDQRLAQVPMPPSGTRVVAVYRGSDAAGEPIVAVGAMPLGK